MNSIFLIKKKKLIRKNFLTSAGFELESPRMLIRNADHSANRLLNFKNISNLYNIII